MRALLSICFIALTINLTAQEGQLSDRAAFLSSQEEAKITAQLRKVYKAAVLRIEVVTVPDQGGKSIREFALVLSESLNLYRAGLSPAALIVLSKRERKVDIVVNPAWEWSLTDGETTRIKREMVNQFRYQNFYQGLTLGIERLAEQATTFSLEVVHQTIEEVKSNLTTGKGRLARLVLTPVTKAYKEEKLSDEQFSAAYFIYTKATDGTLLKLRFSRAGIPLIRLITQSPQAAVTVRIAETNPIDLELLYATSPD